ncbi:hypothetical protein P171DRAFT_430831 [Karstenula rhodostoma CBS 690.94]|uniref:Uncharacterized protein n=1 Tax=Karstenula rhodostoma CBS 690.94 TaxID=1392251 RepID=A0A9P4UDQ5_9PLEO|nr:hypothetical protein P171DRAFT_430831 [Karstenula rhodostoma CBS 690.94]
MVKRHHGTFFESPSSASTTAEKSPNEDIVVLPDTKRCKLSTRTLASTETKNTNPRSPLLNLPGELLNIIYEYALTSDDDLLEYVNVLTVPTNAHSSGIESKIQDTATPSLMEDPNHPVPEQQGGSESVPDVGSGPRTITSASGKIQAHYLLKDGVEFNQLKYVCKKLWRETHHLEVKYNGVLFVDKVGAGVDQIEQLLAAMSPSQRAWLKNITILAGDNETMDDYRDPIWSLYQIVDSEVLTEAIARLDAFCFDRPSSRVQLVSDAFEIIKIVEHDGSLSVYFFSMAVSMSYLLRNTLPTPFAYRSVLDPEFARDIDTPALLRAPNLRIYPRNLVRGIGIDELLASLEAQSTNHSNKPYLMVAREWLTHGI